MQAKLPPSLEEVRLLDMLDGMSGYVVPWAMFSDDHNYLWLNGNYTFDVSPLGTSTMKVSRERGAYTVDISKCQGDRWSRSPSYVGDFAPIPVSILIS